MFLSTLALLAVQGASSTGQVRGSDDTPVVSLQAETARSAAGRAGERQTRDQVAQDTGIKPMARIESRIQNRVQSRIRNRVDRSYEPQANATSPFAAAGDQARSAGRPR